MIDKESCAGDLPVPNLPQVDDGNTVGDAALGLLAIAFFIIHYLGGQARNMFWGHLSEMLLYRASEATTFVNTCRLRDTHRRSHASERVGQSPGGGHPMPTAPLPYEGIPRVNPF
jgi:hypothetical protein